jgi:transcriptional regulator with XRE-family HTH domain
MVDNRPSCLLRETVAKKTAPEPVYLEIGRRIERLREAKALSQSELARRLRKCGLSRAAVSNIESGRQRLMLHVLLEIAEVLDVSPGAILSPGPIPVPAKTKPLTEGLASSGVSLETIAALQPELRHGFET